MPRVKNVEYFRDIQPILAAQLRRLPHAEVEAAGRQAGARRRYADRDARMSSNRCLAPTIRLAADAEAKFGYKPVIHNGTWRNQNASRYVRKFQSRRSLLVWKILGRRTDGWTNDDFPSETSPATATAAVKGGRSQTRSKTAIGPTWTTTAMHAAARSRGGHVSAPERQKIKVAPLSDEDRRTIVRWIDLGCPIDLDYDPAHPSDAATVGCATIIGRR